MVIDMETRPNRENTGFDPFLSLNTGDFVGENSLLGENDWGASFLVASPGRHIQVASVRESLGGSGRRGNDTFSVSFSMHTRTHTKEGVPCFDNYKIQHGECPTLPPQHTHTGESSVICCLYHTFSRRFQQRAHITADYLAKTSASGKILSFSQSVFVFPTIYYREAKMCMSLLKTKRSRVTAQA